MTYNETMAYIASLRSSGICLGLERMQRAADKMGNPQQAYDVIHIAGTNGKGSTASMIAALLTANGYTVGSYTSPVVTDFKDTVCINGQPVDEAIIAEQASLLRDTVSDLSEFEWCTLLTFCIFRAVGVHVAVVECGLGGETDATNILTAPLCAVLTPIALDHSSFLGDTVEKITVQKCGIIKKACHVVCSPAMDDTALGVIFEQAALKNAIVHLPSPATSVEATPYGSRFTYQDKPFTLSMPGIHQIGNALTALSVLQTLHERGYKTDMDIATKALSSVTLPCRQEWIETHTLLDGAHNPHGVDALVQTLRLLQTPVTLVIGMLKDKDPQTCLEKLAPYCEHIVCCTPHNERALTAEELCVIAQSFHGHAVAVDDPAEAYRYAKKITANNTVVVGGSFYTAGVIRRFIKQP